MSNFLAKYYLSSSIHSIYKIKLLNLALVSLLICFMSSCVGGDRVYLVKDEFKGLRIADYIQKNYPVGVNESALVREFTIAGYRYITPIHPSSKRLLVYPSTCPPSGYDLAEGVFITWFSDSEGKLERLEGVKILPCHLTYP